MLEYMQKSMEGLNFLKLALQQKKKKIGHTNDVTKILFSPMFSVL